MVPSSSTGGGGVGGVRGGAGRDGGGGDSGGAEEGAASGRGGGGLGRRGHHGRFGAPADESPHTASGTGEMLGNVGAQLCTPMPSPAADAAWYKAKIKEGLEDICSPRR